MSECPEFYLHHGCIAVSDLDRSIEFYSRILGFEQESRTYVAGISTQIAFLRRGKDRLEIVCHDESKPLPAFAKNVDKDFQVVGTKHMSFATENIELLHAYLEEAGVSGLSEIFRNNPVYYYFFFRDPDGIAIEVVATIN